MIHGVYTCLKQMSHAGKYHSCFDFPREHLYTSPSQLGGFYNCGNFRKLKNLEACTSSFSIFHVVPLFVLETVSNTINLHTY